MSSLATLMPLLNFLAANNGVSLRDAAWATGLHVDEICARLDSISLCGLPPYSPNDYIGYQLIGRGEDAVINLQYARHFARPLNFTPEETLALKYALEHFARAADEASATELADLTEVLSKALQGRARQVFAGNGRGFVVPRQTARMRELIGTLSDAIDGRWIVKLDYFSAHRGKTASRRVHPFQVVEIGAHMYLYAHCELADATRHFRLERIRRAELTDNRFVRRAPPARRSGRMAGIFEGKPRDRLVVRLSAEVARDVADDWRDSPGAEVRALSAGRIELSLPLYNPLWAAGFVISFGEHAELVGPAWLRAEVVQASRASIAAHK